MAVKKRTLNIAALDDDADGVSLSQTPGGAGNLTITGALASGGVATIAAAQPITITSAADETARTFTISGTDADGVTISEAVTGANAGTADSVAYFKTVTQIAVDAATTGAVTAGPLKTNGGVSPSLEVVLSEFPNEFVESMFTQVSAGATLTYSIEMTDDEKNDTFTNSWSTDANWVAISAFSGKSASIAALHTIPCFGLRINLTANTSGTVRMRVLDSRKGNI